MERNVWETWRAACDISVLSPVTSGNSIYGPRIGKLTSQLGGSSCHSLIIVRGRFTYRRLFGEILPRESWNVERRRENQTYRVGFQHLKFEKKRDENIPLGDSSEGKGNPTKSSDREYLSSLKSDKLFGERSLISQSCDFLALLYQLYSVIV